MKTITKKLALAFTALFLSSAAMAQLNQVVVEAYTPTSPTTVQPEGTTTYRVYAEMASATDKLTAMFAILNCHGVNISTTTTFFNDSLRKNFASGIRVRVKLAITKISSQLI